MKPKLAVIPAFDGYWVTLTGTDGRTYLVSSRAATGPDGYDEAKVWLDAYEQELAEWGALKWCQVYGITPQALTHRQPG